MKLTHKIDHTVEIELIEDFENSFISKFITTKVTFNDGDDGEFVVSFGVTEHNLVDGVEFEDKNIEILDGDFDRFLVAMKEARSEHKKKQRERVILDDATIRDYVTTLYNRNGLKARAIVKILGITMRQYRDALYDLDKGNLIQLGK